MSQSATSNISLWGQAWELVVTYANASSATDLTLTSNSWEPEALRMTFEVTQSTLPSQFWYADIKIYNLDDASIQNILSGATWVTLKAGFQTSPGLYARIWSGPVMQAIYTRDANVVDDVVMLRCIAGPSYFTSAVANIATGPGSSQAQIIQRLAQQVGFSISFGQQAQTALSAVTYPRGRGVFGKPMKYIAQLSDSHFMTAWQDGQQAYVSEIGNPDLTPDLTYMPPPGPGASSAQQPSLDAGVTQSIIGTPQQIPQGVIFNVLLDPRLQVQLPPLVVQLKNTLISQLATLPGQGLIAPLSKNLTFFVAQVRHTGDTRGNDWQTEVTGYSTAYADNLLNGIFAAGGGS